MTQTEVRSVPAHAVPPGPTLEEQRARVDELAEAAWEIRTTELDRAHELASEARQIAIRIGYRLGQARAARAMAMTRLSGQEVRDSFQLANESKALFDEVGDHVGRAGARDFLATIYEFLGDLPAGLQLALEALQIAREIDDPVRQGFALSSVGGILAASGDTEGALERLREGLALFEGAANDQGVGRLCSRLSRVLFKAGRMDEALSYAERARASSEASNNSFGRAAAFSLLGDLQENARSLVEAERLYRAALDAYPDQVRVAFGADIHVKLARLLIRRGALGEAAPMLTIVVERLRDLDVALNDQASAHDALAEIAELENELPRALHHLREARRLREIVVQRETRNQMAQIELRAEMETARKDAEIYKLRYVELHGMQTQLVEAEKTALLGMLAAGTAHELNSPLAVLHSNLDAMHAAAKRLTGVDSSGVAGSAEKLLGVLTSCRESSDAALERIAAIAESFRRFTQLDQVERRTFSVIDGLDSAISLLRPTTPEEIRFERRFSTVPAVMAWPRQLNHAFMTVLLNATQAIDGPGVVTIDVFTTDGELVIRVADTGRGMTSAQTTHLFDVGWSAGGSRTKMRLGLSAAHATLRRHGGRIDVESEVGKGTVITFHVPLRDEA